MRSKSSKEIFMELVVIIFSSLSFLFTIFGWITAMWQLKDLRKQLAANKYSIYLFIDGKWILAPQEAIDAGLALVEGRQAYGAITSGLCDHIVDRKKEKIYMFPKGAKVEIPTE
jgi:hypothetical protein